MKIKNINIKKLKKIKKFLLIISMSTLIGCAKEDCTYEKEDIVVISMESIQEDTIENKINIKENANTIENEVNLIEKTNETIEEPKEKKVVALTFDDGPSKYTKDLIQILQENNCNATFFVLGSRVEKYKDMIISAHESGNEIAIHGYSHTSFKEMSIEQIQEEIDLTKQLIEINGVECSNLVRPPGGSINEEIIKNIDTSFILWNVDTKDWKSRDKEKIKEEVIGKLQDGDIVLFHDIYATTIEAIDEIIEELSSEYEFVTVSELFNLKNQEYEENKKYYKVKY